MVLLGHWQLDVSERKGFRLQNFGYALQWWAFCVFALVLWVRVLRDQARPAVGARHNGPSRRRRQPSRSPTVAT